MNQDPLYEAQEAEVKRSRWWRVAWAELARWERRLSQDVKTVAGLVALGGLLYGFLQRPVRWGLRMYHARDVGRAEEQRGGAERMAPDRVPEPPRPR